jgi:hypothetical protein
MLRKRSKRKRGASDWNIKTILLESFFILLAVLLALLLNEWNNERNYQKLADQILESARLEISDNLEIINEVVEYRSEMLQEIRTGKRVIQRIENFENLVDFSFSEKEKMKEFLDNLFISEGLLQMVGVELHEAPQGGYWMPFFNSTARIDLDGKDLVAYGPGNIQLRPAYVSDTVWNTANASNALIHMEFNILNDLSDIYSTQNTYEEIRLQALRMIYEQISIQSAMEDMFWLESELQNKYIAFLEKYK